MKNKPTIICIALLFVTFATSGASAQTIGLFDWAFNIDGSVYVPGDSLPSSVDPSGFDFKSGLGTIHIDFDPKAAGSFFIGAFFDHEIVEEKNTYFNETGASNGTPASGQSWEIDEPGFGSSAVGTGGVQYFGDIFNNFQNGSLDNQIFFDAFYNQSLLLTGDDVSMAMGWNFPFAAAGDRALIELILSDSTVPSGFFLTHTDPQSGASIYFSSTLEIEPIPEPGTILLVGTGLAGLFGWGRRRLKK